MLFDLQKLFGAFTTSVTLFGFATAYHFPDLAPGLPPDVQRDIDKCTNACMPFQYDLDQFSKNTGSSGHWETAKKSFTTCQWKCYRCSLQPVVAEMDSIEAVLNDSNNHDKNIGNQMHDIVSAISNCGNRWTFVGLLGCTKSPVEKAEIACKT